MKQLLNVLKYGLLLAFSGWMMWYALRGQDLSRVGQSILRANYWWLGLTLVLSALGYFSRAYRWKMQIDAAGHRAPFWDVYHAMMVGYLANLVLPRLGEVLRCSVLRRTSGVPVQVGVGTMITERLIDVLVLLLALGATLLLAFDKFWSFTAGLFTDKYDSLAANKTTFVALALIGGVLLLAHRLPALAQPGAPAQAQDVSRSSRASCGVCWRASSASAGCRARACFCSIRSSPGWCTT